METIDSFEGPNRFLSNFYPSEVTLDGTKYPTVEHAYQARKTDRRTMKKIVTGTTTEIISERDWILAAKTPAEAKKRGRKVTLVADWESVKIGAMRDLIRQKFENRMLRAELLSTGDAELIEGNWWNDTFWGICKGRGQNMLGKILMDVRKEIQEETRK